MYSELISVVIPVYNSDKYIGECLDSILNQSYRNLDIIIIDDGSSDKSFKICSRYQENDYRIKLFTQTNSGVSNARNKGILEAQGKYIVFVDADDVLEKNYIEDMYNIICMEKDILVICDFKIWNMDTNKIIFNVDTKENSLLLTMKDFLKDYWNNYKRGYINAPWNKMYNVDIIKNNSIEFPHDITMGEDVVFNMNYFHHCKYVFIMHKYLYNYRNHSMQCSKKIFKNHFVMLKKIFDTIENEFQNYGLMNNYTFLKVHYEAYFNEIKQSIIYLIRDKSTSLSKKKNEFKIISKDARTIEMINFITTRKIKDILLLFLIKHT